MILAWSYSSDHAWTCCVSATVDHVQRGLSVRKSHLTQGIVSSPQFVSELHTLCCSCSSLKSVWKQSSITVFGVKVHSTTGNYSVPFLERVNVILQYHVGYGHFFSLDCSHLTDSFLHVLAVSSDICGFKTASIRDMTKAFLKIEQSIDTGGKSNNHIFLHQLIEV